MAGTGSIEASITERARDWHHALHAAACEPAWTAMDLLRLP